MGELSMISEARARANAKYNTKTYDNLSFKVRKDSGGKARYQDYADSLNISLSELIIKSLEYVIENNIKP